MGYQINYTGSDTAPERKSFRFLLTAVFLALFLVFVINFWPEGRNVLQILFLPGDPDRTLEAAEVFLQELNCGTALEDAARDLYNSIVAYDPVPGT